MRKISIKDAIKILKENNIEALVWSIEDCPIEEFNKLYVKKGNEELVVLAYKEAKYIPYRLTFSDDPYEKPDFITLSFDDDFHIFVVIGDEERTEATQPPDDSVQKYIKIIEENNLPGLLWNFDSCPLKEIRNLQSELTIEKDGEIKNAIRCYVVLHKESGGVEIIPQNMIDEFEVFDIFKNYKITIPIIISEFQHDSNEDTD